MLIHVDPGDARPIYQQIMDEVRRGIVVGSLSPDDPLPSVRQLAGTLRVNPNTVQQAYRELERESVVYVRRGQGTFVAPGAVSERERAELVRGIAERALQEAYRSGVTPAELTDAIHAAANGRAAAPTRTDP